MYSVIIKGGLTIALHREYITTNQTTLLVNVLFRELDR